MAGRHLIVGYNEAEFMEPNIFPPIVFFRAMITIQTTGDNNNLILSLDEGCGSHR